MKAAKMSAALAACMIALCSLGAASASAEFGIAKFASPYSNPFGGNAYQAGSHVDAVTDLEFDKLIDFTGNGTMEGQLKDVEVNLPAGFYGNPQALPVCTMQKLLDAEGFCNPDAQVGVLNYESGAGFFTDFPVYNLPSPDAQTAVLGIVAISVPAKIVISARTDGDFGLTANLSNLNQGLALQKNKLTLWGVPADPIHDVDRFFENGGLFGKGASSSQPRRPFLSIPPRCGPMTTTLKAASWQNPTDWRFATYTSPPVTGCEELEFGPSLSVRPTTNVADSPSGLEADLHIPQNDDPDGLSVAHLKKAEVKLPEGLVINPAAANGLGACSPSEIGLTTLVGAGSPHFNKAPAACPDNASIGAVEVETPVFADPLRGKVYTMAPYQNPFGDLLGFYVVIEGKGLVVKLAAKVHADPKTGQLSAVFDENPQLPFEHFRLNFDGGASGALRTPATCGSFTTDWQMTPWPAPAIPSVSDTDEWAITQAPAGGSCAADEAQRPHKPAFEAGSLAPLAGAYKPFVVNLRREDGSQQFSAVTLTPPPGLVAKLKGTAICSDGALAAAASKTGRQEQASPSCSATSAVGNVYAAAGAGPAPFNAPGKVYLTGPYKGAPLSFAFVVPATAGPFDLGTVVTRAAAFANPVTAEVTVKADPLPTILEGIPLDVRSISVRLDKPDFTLNPTSCDPLAVTGSLLSTTGALAPLSNRFQLAECGRLKFKPSLKLSLKGGVKRGEYQALRAVLTNRPGDANIASVQVALPHSEFLAQEHIKTICTRAQWAADACPKGSIYGTVKVETPLLDQPLTGNVYLRSSANPLPDLVPDLRGSSSQPIRFESAGKIDSIKGGIRNTFSFVPDVPFSRLTLQLKGGEKGLLVNSRDICNSVSRANVDYTAHNGASYSVRPELKAPGCGGKGKKGGKKKGRHG